MDFSQLAVLVSVSALFAFIAKIFRQPLLVGYMFAGLALAWTGFIGNQEDLESMGRVGVALLLFLLGLEMNLKEVASIGKHATIAGFFEMLLTAVVGFLLSLALGFSVVTASYIAIALTFSSTIIMVKLLSEKKDLQSLYGKISVGSLLFQDVLAIFILMFLAGSGSRSSNLGDYVFIAIKLAALLVAVWIIAKKVAPYFIEKFVSSSPELLYIVSIAWALGMSSFIAGPLGFSLEIGGFLAGLSLSALPEHLQIASRSRSLRDFFLTIFFIYLGTHLVIEGSIAEIIAPSLLFSAVVIFINPISVLAVMGYMGYKKRTSFLSALTVSQTSEFSLILLTVGYGLGHVDQSAVAIIVLVTIITMTASTYLILGADGLYRILAPYLTIFERKRTKEELSSLKDYHDHLVLVGCDRAGRMIVKYLKQQKLDFVVIDFNPDVVKRLTADQIDAIYGDISDPEMWNDIRLDKAKIVVSTIPSTEDNLVMLEMLKSSENKPVTIFAASNRRNAIKLYEYGATYVVVPEFIAGEHIRQTLKFYSKDLDKFKRLGKSQFKRLLTM